MRILQKAGALRSGSDSRGRIWHAVENGNSYNGPSLCGQMPRIQWSSYDGSVITCPRCLDLANQQITTEVK